MSRIDRRTYAQLYGPTTGDRVRLADTSLWAEVEHDHAVYGDELAGKVGGTIREGQGVAPTQTDAADLVVTNVVVIDPVLGIIKGDLGVRDGRIIGIGKAGNPDVMDGVTIIVGPRTTILPGERLIATPGAVEAHAHLMSPQQIDHLLAGGVTTAIAMEWGAVLDIAVSGPTAINTMMRAFETMPINIGFLGRGSANDADTITESVAFGCVGVKVHEDLGASPAAIDAALRAADAADFSVCVHTDSLNETGFVDETISAIDGRSVHLFHTEGAGGGHVPDIITVNGLANVIPSSTNPTNPYTANGVVESVPMTMLVHGLSFSLDADVRLAESRGRAATMMAEDLLHDLGAISIFAADTQGMGRAQENLACLWRLASVMRDRVGRLDIETTAYADNERILRYLAKATINPAIAYGIDEHVGSLEVGKLADFVLWDPRFFGLRPLMVVKSGVPVSAAMGDANGSHPATEPVRHRAQFGGTGLAPAYNSVVFSSALGVDHLRSLGCARPVVPIRSVRSLGKRDMVRNFALPDITVDPRTFAVHADGALLECEPATDLALNHRYLIR